MATHDNWNEILMRTGMSRGVQRAKVCYNMPTFSHHGDDALVVNFKDNHRSVPSHVLRYLPRDYKELRLERCVFEEGRGKICARLHSLRNGTEAVCDS